jgi:hypothetical protein
LNSLLADRMLCSAAELKDSTRSREVQPHMDQASLNSVARAQLAAGHLQSKDARHAKKSRKHRCRAVTG